MSSSTSAPGVWSSLAEVPVLGGEEAGLRRGANATPGRGRRRRARRPDPSTSTTWDRAAGEQLVRVALPVGEEARGRRRGSRSGRRTGLGSTRRPSTSGVTRLPSDQARSPPWRVVQPGAWVASLGARQQPVGGSVTFRGCRTDARTLEGMSVQMMSVMATAMRELRQHRSPSDPGRAGRHTLVDSTAARLVWEPRRIVSAYAVPVADIAGTLVNPQATARGPVAATGAEPAAGVRRPLGHRHRIRHRDLGRDPAWGRLRRRRPGPGGVRDSRLERLHALFEEGEEVRGHPREPFHSIRCLPSDRHVVVEVDGQVVADTTRAVMLVETSLPVRRDVPREDVHGPAHALRLATPSAGLQGQAADESYGDVADVVWTYEDPRHEARRYARAFVLRVEFTDLTSSSASASLRPCREWSRSRPADLRRSG